MTAFKFVIFASKLKIFLFFSFCINLFHFDKTRIVGLSKIQFHEASFLSERLDQTRVELFHGLPIDICHVALSGTQLRHILVAKLNVRNPEIYKNRCN